MNVQHKDATITNTDDAFPGSFQVILSTKAKDRDGDELQSEDWKQPLPDHITFDADHGMSVATTVGSGRPYIDTEGRMAVDGTYSSLARAQEVRTLVNEGHIRTTSVAFMTEKSTQKDGTTKSERELLNGAFVAIPSNTEALVLASKGLKAGARNSKTDGEHIQAIHDHALALGATPAPGDDTGAAQGSAGGKALTKDALDPQESSADDPTVTADPKTLALAVDAAIDQALALLVDVDLTSLPGEVQRAIALVQTADAASDDLLDALGVPDPDEDETATEAPAAEKAAELDDVDLKYRALLIEVAAASSPE